MTPEVRATVSLLGDDAASYCEAVVSAIRGARLNNFFPDSKRTRSHIEAMSPVVHRGVYDEIEVDQQSGLPTYKIWTRVQADATLAPKQLRLMGKREVLEQKAKAHPDTVHQRQLAKWDYYRSLSSGHEMAALGHVSVKVRRLEGGVGHFRVVLDKFDVNGVFLRYLIDLSQHTSGDGLIVVSEAQKLARQTEDLRGLIYKFAAVSSSSTFAKLASIPEIAVERVHKGTIGPIYFPWSNDVPQALAPVVEAAGWVATFSSDNAATDIELSVCNDPFSSLPSDGVPERFGFRLFRDRKFVVPRKHLGALRAALPGAKCIMYGV